jgi:endonuclease/exonuclease/phosphatase family metal-dependent hydrolase
VNYFTPSRRARRDTGPRHIQERGIDVPFYNRLRFKIPPAELERVIDNLAALRAQLDKDLPAKDADNHLLLATWNIRDFAKVNRRGFGKRIPESLFYIAEILSRFDFVAVQEVNGLGELYEVMAILGPDWDFIASDETDTKLGGNGERLAFLYDRRKVWFQKIAGEIVLPAELLISRAEVEAGGGGKLYAGKQFRRTPYVAKFQSGWFKFSICTVHLYYGAASGPQLKERIEEIQQVAAYLSGRADRELTKNQRALILLGDFNIVHPEHKTMKALLDSGFVVPKSLRAPTNIDRSKFYDQIAFKTDPRVVEFVDKPGSGNAGVFEIFESVFADDQVEQYRQAAAATTNGKGKSGAELEKYYLEWRTYQMSDHKPMWVRLRSDDSAAYLERLKSGPPATDERPI